jgi:cation:H+ antiporter
MTAALLPWLKFAACVALIAFAGPSLIRYGEVLARLTGMSRSWVGLVLVATTTSLPELFTGISAVTVADAPNIAVGDALGSCVFNLAMLVILDELYRGEPMYRRIDQSHILSAGFGVILIGAAGAFLLLSHDALSIQVLHVSGYTPFIVVIYFVAMRAAFVYERRNRVQAEAVHAESGLTLRGAALRYAAAAGVIAVAGSWLPFVGQEIAAATGWKTTFVGTLLIAGATSVPELVVTVSAARRGAVDMAIGSVLGSNLFDILVLAIDDLAYLRGSLFAAASPAHAVTALGAAIMSGIFVVAVLYRPETRLRGTIGWVSLSLLVVYLFSSYAAYLLGH